MTCRILSQNIQFWTEFVHFTLLFSSLLLRVYKEHASYFLFFSGPFPSLSEDNKRFSGLYSSSLIWASCILKFGNDSVLSNGCCSISSQPDGVVLIPGISHISPLISKENSVVPSSGFSAWLSTDVIVYLQPRNLVFVLLTQMTVLNWSSPLLLLMNNFVFFFLHFDHWTFFFSNFFISCDVCDKSRVDVIFSLYFLDNPKHLNKISEMN